MIDERPRGLLRLASQWLLGVLLAVSLTAFFASVNAVQLTSEGAGQRILRRAVAVLTDIDALLPDIEKSLHQTAQDSSADTVQVPDFPIPVELPREEARTLSGAQLRERILGVSAEEAYAEGLEVFAAADPEGHRDIELFSTQGTIDRGLGLITDDTHTKLIIAAVVLGVVSATLSLLLLSAARSYGRLVALGATILAAALPSLAAAVAIRFGFRTAQEEADPFLDGLLQLGIDAMWVPIRNYTALSALGAALLALSIGLIWASGRREPSPASPTVNSGSG